MALLADKKAAQAKLDAADEAVASPIMPKVVGTLDTAVAEQAHGAVASRKVRPLSRRKVSYRDGILDGLKGQSHIEP